MANVDIVIRTVTQGEQSASKSIKASFTEINQAIELARKALEALKKGYQFAKEGAMIDFLSTKFDRLSESIGTTSDKLLKDLREATRGMFSDMELMQMASDLVGLGLAKDADEAVRLSRVAAALNMNMSQLVLTLTNMTTMRFDQLGVSVDGFDEKVKQLQTTGMSANDAFKEAFLQQAEAQVLKTGEAADTAAGAFMRLESQAKNAADSLKVAWAETTEGLVNGLADWLEAANRITDIRDRADKAVRDGTITYAEYADILARVNDEENGAARAAVALDMALGNIPDSATASYIGMAEALGVLSTAEMEAGTAIEGMNQDFSGLFGVILEAQDIADEYANTQADLAKKMEEVNQKIEEAKSQGYSEAGSKIRGLRDEYAELAGQVDAAAAAFERQQKMMIFGLLQEKMKEGGLTSAEFNMLLATGQALDVIDEKSATLGMAINKGLEEIDITSIASVYDFLTGIMDLPEDKAINIALNVTSNNPGLLGSLQNTAQGPSLGSNIPIIPQAAGGEWDVNRPTLFLAGEAGSEHVSFTPTRGGKPKKQAQSVTNNYYAPVTLQPSPADVAFAELMQ